VENHDFSSPASRLGLTQNEYNTCASTPRGGSISYDFCDRVGFYADPHPYLGYLHSGSNDAYQPGFTQSNAPSFLPSVRTPFEVVDQATDPASLAARAAVEGGARIWRVGTTGRSNAADAQFWSLEHPSTPGFAERHGIPPENVLQTDFIESAVVPPGTPFVTRQAPGVGPNPGGGIEVVVPEGSVTMCGFSITGGC